MSIEARARHLSTRAPWIYEEVLAKLQAHRIMWQRRYEDMMGMANGACPGDKLAQIGATSVHQILLDGEALYLEINAMVSRAVLSQEGKPRSREWDEEQRREGREKLRLIRGGKNNPE